MATPSEIFFPVNTPRWLAGLVVVDLILSGLSLSFLLAAWMKRHL
ncbi:hypothetical protein PC116_g32038 [Phytophthora cactorum]|nr:hypothetical protein PC116_g32038 [Phytophthora cactorum]